MKKYFLKFSVLIFFIALFSSASFAQQVSSAPLVSPVEIVGEIPVESQGDFLNGFEIARPKLVQTVLVLLLCYAFIFLLVRISNRRIKSLKARHAIRKNIVYIGNIILLFFVVLIWIHNIGSITIFLGVASAGVALALQEVILSVAGWFLILMRRPFEAGDRIELGDVKGDVIDIRLFQTSLLEIGNWVDADQSTGRIVHIPNSFVFKKELYNYTRGFEFIWNEIKVLVTFESDWKKGKEIMLAHAQSQAQGMESIVKSAIDRMAHSYMIYYQKFTPIVYVNIKDSGVELTLRYLTEAKKRRSTQDELSQMILDDFGKEPNVDFAYPTYRIIKT
ncbi:MAG: mechanosensitive ion channel [Candidatus Omnitrophica bacterium]|nr:mechanosensitive ion channel [Candidatus Omnitrophota bacterium]